ncbi:hypothetical protein [Paraglaciecola sp. L3A3]|uniref:hypothetical protein n=1 Tax=Paraglaciecola sp. L3A3 TaxID=2686358 RepID=UPI00131E2CC6|nr:hypothetical protein [Paraglaciecola sp. L3A3]
MKNILLLPIIFTVMQGCSSIDQPVASRALVEHHFVADAPSVDLSLGTALSNSKTGAVLTINNQEAVVGAKFFAASGFICRKVIAKPSGQDIYCKNSDKGWFQVNKVISEYSEKAMSEVSL